MRRIYLFWTITVFGIVASLYGGSSLIYTFSHKKELSVSGLILLIIGLIVLLFVLIVYLSSYFLNKKKKVESTPILKEEKVEEPEPNKEIEKKEPVKETKPKPKQKEEYVERSYRPSRSIYDSSSPTIYVKQLGYGPLLRFDGNRILDMRTNTYYRIEGNMVKQEGYGPLFEIRGNQIKNAFGGYLYEISGSNINKVFGGFYASISGNYITIYDLSVKYEMTDRLSNNQILALAVLLFGKY